MCFEWEVRNQIYNGVEHSFAWVNNGGFQVSPVQPNFGLVSMGTRSLDCTEGGASLDCTPRLTLASRRVYALYLG